MDIWQIVVIVVLAALILVWVAVIAYNKGRVSGRLAAEQDLSGDEDTHSLFGDDAPVRPTERRLIEVLPEALDRHRPQRSGPIFKPRLSAIRPSLRRPTQLA